VGPYICAGEEVIGSLDGTFHKAILGFDRLASVTCDRFVGRLAWWSVVRAIWNADRGPCPDVAAVHELVDLLDSTTQEVILLVEFLAGVTRNGDVSREARRRWGAVGRRSGGQRASRSSGRRADRSGGRPRKRNT